MELERWEYDVLMHAMHYALPEMIYHHRITERQWDKVVDKLVQAYKEG